MADDKAPNIFHGLERPAVVVSGLLAVVIAISGLSFMWLNALHGNVTGLQNELSGIRQAVTSIEGGINGANGSIGMKDRLAGVETTVAAINRASDVHTNSLKSIESKLDAVVGNSTRDRAESLATITSLKTDFEKYSAVLGDPISLFRGNPEIINVVVKALLSSPEFNAAFQEAVFKASQQDSPQ